MSALPSPTRQVDAFYAGQSSARWLRRGLRAARRLSPALAVDLAMRLFFTPMPSKLAARARPAPAAWEAERLRFEDGAIALWRRGDTGGQDRPKVLLVHGWAGDAMQLRPIADALAADGFEPLLLDFPGHGRSDGWRATLPQFVRAMFAVQARVGPLHAVVAHSLGALAAVHAAARGLAVERLALVAAPIAPARFVQGFAHAFGLGPALAQRLHDAIQRSAGTPLVEFESSWLGERVAQAVLLVHDRDDRVAPLAAAQALAQALPDARLRLTEGLGHRRLLADAGVAATVIAHLRSDPRAGDTKTHEGRAASLL